ncbi:MAG: HD domain-containing protein [Bradymonadales bacterium]|nr:MAG: HD domain-containing protein [Bradymonadales bacterium]
MRRLPIEIRCPIHGAIRADRDEIRIIDSPYFQRLRGIKQMGFAELAFPGATHNRYSHSLGAFHMAGLAFRNLFEDFEWNSPEEMKRIWSVLRLSALLHDVGHGPLSHAIEQAMPSKALITEGSGKASHEDYSRAILLRSSLTPLIEGIFGKEMPLAIASVVQGQDLCPGFFSVGRSQQSVLPAVSSLISGEIDVDRMDYMKRDSLHCGTTYGNYDQDWIFSNLLLHENQDQLHLAIDSRALYAIEDFLLSRYHMYLMVYLHHKAVVYDEMLYQFLQTDEEQTKVPHDIKAYLEVDDYWLQTRLRASKNPWARRIVEQKPYRLLLELHSDEAEESIRYADDLEDRLKKENIPYFRSSSTGLLSRTFETGKPLTKSFPLYIVYRDPRFVSASRPQNRAEALSEASDLFQGYHKKRIIDRIYADAEPHNWRAENKN